MQLRHTAKEIGEASQSVADGVSGQAAAVVETIASVEHMSESAKTNSDRARKVAIEAEGAGEHTWLPDEHRR